MNSRRLNPIVDYTDVEEASLLRMRGLYVTGHRLTALNAIQQHSPIPHKKLIQIIANHGASIPTAHRIIEAFIKHKIVRTTVIGGKPCLSRIRPLSNYQIYKICPKCSQQTLIRSRAISKAIRRETSHRQCHLQSYDLQIFARCPSCSNQA